MHMALPLRRSSNLSLYPAQSHSYSNVLKTRIKSIVIGICIAGALIFVMMKGFGNSNHALTGKPSVVVVTVLDSGRYRKDHLEHIKENRIRYAKYHGYATFMPNISDYDLNGAPGTWSRIPAVRHALAKFDKSTYVWYLEQNSLIMNPKIKVERDIMHPSKLEDLMIKDQPIVPPSSVIKTFPKLKGTNIDLALTQDKNGLAPDSFIVRNGEWSRFFLDTWFDPMYRSYNFQKADSHALEHIVQWHPTILSKLALVPQKVMNSYNKPDLASDSGVYKEGDFVLKLAGCEEPGSDCAALAQSYLTQWRSAFGN
ncbi:unnamed protein product [Blumeria hordei]|uniref:Uncharacterized protein n=1 Tax=Blumeria hordei TaxID=2867405 RepID=A0A383UQF2_BLUHO|nr:unnamed protein product [Blumeria hordei]